MKIAALTSVITINVLELFMLYSYTIPNILFYTLPIAYFIALVISLSKLSSEYELIVITSFGLNPLKILKIFLPMTLLLSVALVVVSVGLIPKTKFLTNQMLSVKKKEANFNIKSSEFGQKFGDWMIYITDKNEKTYSDVKLFKTENFTDQFIVSKNAVLRNSDGELTFTLNEGKLFYINPKELNQINFETMLIGDSIANNSSEVFTTPFEYWATKLSLNQTTDKFVFFILVSIFPLVSLFLVIAFGYFNPRYEKNRSLPYAIVFVVLYYFLADYSSKHFYYVALYTIPFLWSALCYYVYMKKIKQVY